MEKKVVKELKDDAMLDIKVNKTYYLMCKAALFTTLNNIYSTEKHGSPDDFVKSIVSKKYEDLDDSQRTFYTLTLLVGEIEKQALENDAFVEKEIDPKEIKKELEKVEKSNED
jgi:hypothetical protein